MTNQISMKERQAEQRTKASTARALSADQGLVHELQAHQIELEMQNEELHKIQEQLGESLDKYADL